MKYFEKVPAILLLKDGTVFHGNSAGKIGTTTGEICFNTGMTGYQEIFTDPSYYKQIVIMTNVHIGNYATNHEESESKDVMVSGVVTRNFTNLFSRKDADLSIQDYFIENELVGITDIDTRALVKYIRDKGAMNCIISSETTDIDVLKEQLAKVPTMVGLELASKVSCEEAYEVKAEEEKHKVALLDLGCKDNIVRSLVSRGCTVKVFPSKTSFEDMKAWKPNGFMISNGPGDPKSMDYAVKTVQQIMEDETPLFGICLGHQILCLANGLSTYKMHNGHRGINHPVQNLETGLSEITSQNHGFGVDPKSINDSDKVKITHVNLNDDTIEGIKVIDKPAFSVQYHPEAAPGPHDSRYLFDQFIQSMN